MNIVAARHPHPVAGTFSRSSDGFLNVIALEVRASVSRATFPFPNTKEAHRESNQRTATSEHPV